MGEATFTNETSSGWQEVRFAQPVPVQAHTVYIASYYAPVGRYAADVGYFRDREVVNSPLRLPSQGAINGNGAIRAGHGFPIPGDPSPQHDTNYWVDVVFTPNTPPPSPPPAPATLSATAVSTSQVDLSWSAVTEATGYRVERSTDTATWNPIANPAAGVTSYSDTGLAASTPYSYRVVATNGEGDSPPSPVASATTNTPPPTPPPAPASLTATAVSASRVDLSWSAVTEATGYRVERSTDTTTWSPVATTAAGVTSYSDTGLAASTTYSYRVVATGDGGDSAPSPVASATTAAPPDTTSPTAPSGLKAASAKGKVNLSWSGSTDAGGSGLAGYIVWRGTAGASGPFTSIATITSTSYSDLTAASRVQYLVSSLRVRPRRQPQPAVQRDQCPGQVAEPLPVSDRDVSPVQAVPVGSGGWRSRASNRLTTLSRVQTDISPEPVRSTDLTSTPPTLAFFGGGDRIEDWLDKVGVSLDTFRSELSGGWLFNYVQALQLAGVRVVMCFASARADEIERFVHEPTGAPVCLFPSPWAHRKVRAAQHRFELTSPVVSSVSSYVATPLVAVARELRRHGCDAILCHEYESPRFDECVLLGRVLHLPVFGTYQGSQRPVSWIESPLRRLSVGRSAGFDHRGRDRDPACSEHVPGAQEEDRPHPQSDGRCPLAAHGSA